MSDAAVMADSHEIVVDEVFPHAPEVVWKTLTTAKLMGRWLMMMPTGFEPTKGKRFTYQTTPAGEWDGVIHCLVLDVIPNERLVYEWRGGHDANAGYGSRFSDISPHDFSTASFDSADFHGRSKASNPTPWNTHAPAASAGLAATPGLRYADQNAF